MVSRSFKSLLVAAFSLSCIFFSNMSMAEETPKINPSEIILDHVADAHEFHFFTLNKKPVSIPLPVILYSPDKGWSSFMASRFEENGTYNGYVLIDKEMLGKDSTLKTK